MQEHHERVQSLRRLLDEGMSVRLNPAPARHEHLQAGLDAGLSEAEMLATIDEPPRPTDW
jgi:hypothetical protein